MFSLTRHFFISLCAAGILIGAYHFAFSTKEIIVTPQVTPMVQTAYESPIVVRDSAENTDFTLAVDRTIDAVVHITNKGKSSSHSYNLWVASSMGQEKRKEISASFDIQIFDMKLFLKSLNLNPENYKEKPAMQPDICIQCNKNNDLKKLLKAINTIRDNQNNQILEF